MTLNPFLQYFLDNFFLLCISFGIVFMVLRNYRTKKVVVLMPILIVSCTILLSIAYAIEKACLENPDLLFLSVLCFYLGFAFRPLILLFFIRIQINNKLIFRIAVGLVIANAILYSFCLFIHVPALSHLVYWYEVKDGVISPQRGPLYFVSYFIVGAMMIYLIFMSISALKGRHRYDALASLICVAFIGLAVLLETLLYTSKLLNTTIAIACLFYIVHLFQQAAQRDGLTNLFDRKTYYADSQKLYTRVRGVLLIDMNSLKRINDSEGHEAGDKAIITVGKTLLSVSNHSMYVYRMGGDEFLIMVVSNKEHILEDTADRIKARIADTPYSVSIGYAYKQNPDDPVSVPAREAEKMMYEDKAEYYRTSGIERRKN